MLTALLITSSRHRRQPERKADIREAHASHAHHVHRSGRPPRHRRQYQQQLSKHGQVAFTGWLHSICGSARIVDYAGAVLVDEATFIRTK